MKDPKYLNEICEDKLPGLLGIKMTQLGAVEVRAEMEVTESRLAPNGYLHAGSVVSLALLNVSQHRYTRAVQSGNELKLNVFLQII